MSEADKPDPAEQHQTGKRQTAVAIKSDDTDGASPRVTAVGHGENAEQMLDLAFDNDVKVRKDSDLAEVLGAMDVDSPVPIEALEAVGEILNFVYKANQSWTDQTTADQTAKNHFQNKI